jgi:hypothetical protein
MKSITPSPLFAVLGVATVLLAGCTKDEVVGRYQSAACVVDIDDAHIDRASKPCREVVPRAEVAVVTIPTPGGAAVTLSATVPAAPTASAAPATASAPASPANGLSLPERAMATYIAALANPNVAKAADALRKNIAAPFEAAGPATMDDETIFHRTMVVTVARDPLYFNPADRIEAVDVAIKPDNAIIRSWDAAATIYSTINAGTVQLTGTASGTGSASVGTPAAAPVVGSLSGSFTQSQSRVENYTAAQQAESLTISLRNNDTYLWDKANRNTLRIHRQGGIGIDLTGNIIVKVDIVLPEDPGSSPVPIRISRRWLFSVKGDYFDKNGRWTKPTSLALDPRLVLVAKHVDPATRPTPVTATVTLIYTLRHILSGDDTLEEKDDRVTDKTMRVETPGVILIPGGEVSPRAYSVIANYAKGAPLMIQRPDAPGLEALCFGSYDAANDLVTYLRKSGAAKPDVFGTARLGFSTIDSAHPLAPLQAADLRGLEAVGACPD